MKWINVWVLIDMVATGTNIQKLIKYLQPSSQFLYSFYLNSNSSLINKEIAEKTVGASFIEKHFHRGC